MSAHMRRIYYQYQVKRRKMKSEESGILKKVALTAAERMRNMRQRRKLASGQSASTSVVPLGCTSKETASTSASTIVMDTIKAEPEIDPLASEIEDKYVENENLLSVEGNFLEVNVNEIKVEPSDLSCDNLPDVKCEGNEDPVYPELKFEVEEHSWNVDTMKEDPIPDVMEENCELTEITVQPQSHADVRITPQIRKQNRRSNLEVKAFKCNLCEKSFGHRHHLVKHASTHTDEKPFTCNFCERGFALRTYLQTHLLTHTGEKHFKCKICYRSFTQINNLRRHESMHKNEKPFKCDFCEKSFALRLYLQTHTLTHTGEKHFKCKTCNKSFTQSNHLKRHETTHNNEKHYTCDICNKNFAIREYLQRHIVIHNRNKPFKCDVCKMGFSTQQELRQHSASHTDKKQ